jgi:hypothetical protein
MASSTTKMKKKPAKKLAKPIIRSSSQQLESDAVESNTPNNHSEKKRER